MHQAHVELPRASARSSKRNPPLIVLPPVLPLTGQTDRSRKLISVDALAAPRARVELPQRGPAPKSGQPSLLAEPIPCPSKALLPLPLLPVISPPGPIPGLPRRPV